MQQDASQIRIEKAKPEPRVSSYEPVLSEEEVNALVDRMVEMEKAATSGSRGPFDPELVEVSGHKKLWDMNNTDPRKEFVGVFMGSSPSRVGERALMGEAAYTDRRDAMAVAYHFGALLQSSLIATVAGLPYVTDDMYEPSGQLIGISASGEFLDGNEMVHATEDAGTHYMVSDMRDMEMYSASLANKFNFDSTTVTAAAYAGEVKGFSLSLGGFGKLADFAADGSITFYGSDGKAWSTADYNAANVDGGIPELHNNEIDRLDREAELRSRQN